MAKKKKKAAKPAKQSKPAKAKSKPTKAAAGPKPAAKPAAGSGRKSSWLDENSNKPLIDSYARRLKSFMDALADGKVDASEVQAQEERLVGLMKEVEPQLDAATHAKVTQLLCELTAYDLMQILHSMEAARPKTTFRG